MIDRLIIISSSSSFYLFHSHNAVKIRHNKIKTFGMKKDNKARSALTVDQYTYVRVHALVRRRARRGV